MFLSFFIDFFLAAFILATLSAKSLLFSLNSCKVDFVLSTRLVTSFSCFRSRRTLVYFAFVTFVLAMPSVKSFSYFFDLFYCPYHDWLMHLIYFFFFSFSLCVHVSGFWDKRWITINMKNLLSFYLSKLKWCRQPAVFSFSAMPITSYQQVNL